MQQDVLAFQVAFDQLPRKPGYPVSFVDLELGSQLIAEEITELGDGVEDFLECPNLDNLVQIVDGAIDSIYVILWLLNKINVPVEAVWAEVQRSNMAKLNPDGSFTKWTEGPKIGKVKKPDSWTAPDLHSILAPCFPCEASYVAEE
jgi:hypothetical protein